MSTYVKGLDTVISNLNKELKNIEGKTLKGLIRGAIIIRRKMEFVPPVIPVDTGNLRASWFIVTTRSIQDGENPEFKGEKAGELAANHTAVVKDVQRMVSGKIAIGMGFTANYAAAVHEKIETKFRRPGSGAKFFQAAINNSMAEVINIVKEEAEI